MFELSPIATAEPAEEIFRSISSARELTIQGWTIRGYLA
jgi:hypothetical protein